MLVTIKTLKKENAGLRTQVGALMIQIKNLQAKFDPCRHVLLRPRNRKAQNSLDWNVFRAAALQEISAIKCNLEKIADKVEEHSLAIEEIQTYSYRFNV